MFKSIADGLGNINTSVFQIRTTITPSADKMIFQINKSWLAGALLAASVALASTCENVTVTQSLPSDSNVALESYSYCGGYLAATAYIKVSQFVQLTQIILTKYRT